MERNTMSTTTKEWIEYYVRNYEYTNLKVLNALKKKTLKNLEQWIEITEVFPNLPKHKLNSIHNEIEALNYLIVNNKAIERMQIEL